MNEPVPRSLPGRVREQRLGLPLKGILLLVVCVALLGGCGARRAGGAPSVEFGRVPMAEQGGAENLDEIEGRAVGARAGHWGRSGMRERARDFGAEFEVRSRAGEGTEVRLSVPGDVAYASDLVSDGAGRLMRFVPRRWRLSRRREVDK